ncbi:MAG: ArsR/SmtB family transcription factor [Gammaproteobacteria bacterium]
MKKAVTALAALAHERRLAVFRLLVKAGPAGRPAGDIAAALEIPKNTLSTHLAALTRAELLTAQRDGRHIIYRAHFNGMSSLLGFLLKDCCQADPSSTQHALECLVTSCVAPTTTPESPS